MRSVVGLIRGRRSEHRGLPAGPAVALAVSAALLLLIGLAMIVSASQNVLSRDSAPLSLFARQVVWAVIAACAFGACAWADYGRWRSGGYVLLGASFLGLVAVMTFGVTAGGSTRWLQAGPLRIQPSEFAKLGVVCVTAVLCAKRPPRSLKDLTPIAVLAGSAVLLVAIEDFGTALVIALLALAIVFAAGIPGRLIRRILGWSAAGMLVLLLARDYRLSRLRGWFDCFFSTAAADPLDACHQVYQAKIALGSGGIFGVGLGTSRQPVPNAHTDFIFAILGEETGLVGTLLVLTLFAVVAHAGIQIARRAPDRFSQLVAAGVTAWIAGQAVINIGGVTGILPITGIPLPLVSFGGSALVSIAAALGILVSIARRTPALQLTAGRAASDPFPAHLSPTSR